MKIKLKRKELIKEYILNSVKDGEIVEAEFNKLINIIEKTIEVVFYEHCQNERTDSR